MKEGAWINSTSGTFAWIDEHAHWIRQPAHARSLGLSEETIKRLTEQVPDFNGVGRVGVLKVAMDAGLIRFRGHGERCTLEGTLSCQQILQGAANLLRACMGPHMSVCIHDLVRQEEVAAPWWVLEHILDGNPEELQALVKPCVLAPQAQEIMTTATCQGPG
ncbi:hypothetical protein [Holophaga foetida]|uniref:hypothetical protein n=1 Tax=Holophaga foetida TaxID=35839 RepID=UPI0002472111|nr:hypothetical protein [Holophaga foetida]